MDTKVKLLFIVPVHESNDCLQDTIDNVRKYNSDCDCYFVISVARSFKDFDQARFSSQAGVIVGQGLDNRAGNRYESQLESYIRAYTLAKQSVSDFAYIKVHHTSELFVRPGMYDYMKNFDFAYKRLEQEEPLPGRYHPIIRLGTFRDILPDYQNPESYRYQLVEAAFYTKFVFDYVEHYVYNKLHTSVSELNTYFNYTAIEEIVIPTLALLCGVEHNLRIGDNVLNYVQNIDDYQLEPQHYTVKHVPRKYDHPLRVKMRTA